MALSKQEQAAQAQFNTLDSAYTKALYANPRDEAECLRLAQELLLLCTGTRLERSAVTRVQRHQPRTPKAE